MMTETSAQLTDLSKHGIGLKAPKRLRPGSPCMVTVGNNGSPVILSGTSVWERFAGWVANPRGQSDAFFFAGIRFDDERQDIMTRLCATNAMLSGRSRMRVSRDRAPDMPKRFRNNLGCGVCSPNH
jgi:hypothetical protein